MDLIKIMEIIYNKKQTTHKFLFTQKFLMIVHGSLLLKTASFCETLRDLLKKDKTSPPSKCSSCLVAR